MERLFLGLSGPKSSLRCTALSYELISELLSLSLLAAVYTIIPVTGLVHA